MEKKYSIRKFLLKILTSFAIFFILFFSLFSNNANNNISSSDSVLSSQNLPNEDYSKIAVTGGSINLQGIYGFEGQDKNKWLGFNEKGDITRKCQKYLYDSTEKKIIENQIHISNDGIINWDKINEIKTFTFRVVYYFEENSNKKYFGYSAEVTLYIRPAFYLGGGNENLIGKYHEVGNDNKKWSTFYHYTDVTLKCKKELINAPVGVDISDDGMIFWNDEIEPNSYLFKIVYTYDVDGKILQAEQEILLQILSNFSINGGSLELTAYSNASGSDIKSWSVNLNGDDVTQYSTLSLINAPDGIVISQTGIISWGSNLNVGVYNLQVKALYYAPAEYFAFSQTITLNVKLDFFIDGGSTYIKWSKGDSCIDPKTWLAIYSKESTTDVKWSILGIKSDLFHIQDGVVYWEDNIQPGIYCFIIQAKYHNLDNYCAVSPVIAFESVPYDFIQDNANFILITIGAAALVALIVSTPIFISYAKNKKKKLDEKKKQSK